MTRIARMPALAVAIGLLCCSERIALGQVRPPNIVLLVADDMGYADIGVHGSRDIPTPNIDALAREGSPLHRCVCDWPVLQSDARRVVDGRYQQRFGHEFNLGPAGRRSGCH